MFISVLFVCDTGRTCTCKKQFLPKVNNYNIGTMRTGSLVFSSQDIFLWPELRVLGTFDVLEKKKKDPGTRKQLLAYDAKNGIQNSPLMHFFILAK